MMKPDRLPSLANRRRMIAWMLFGVVVMAVISIKSFNDGWFEPKTPLALNGEPALVFLTLGRGCECQMRVVRSAEAQLASWSVTLNGQISILRVDFSRRPDLARQFDIARAPALVLLDSNSEVVWKQDVGLSDEDPLDLEQAKDQVELLLSEETR